MRNFSLAFALCLTGFNSFGQAVPTQIRAANTLYRLGQRSGVGNNDLIQGIPFPPSEIIGDNYLDKKWNAATVLLYQSETMLEGYLVKYDVKNDVLEFNTSSGIKVLDGRKVKNMVWVDSLTALPHYFVNGAEYKINGVAGYGLLEVVVDGTAPLLKKAEIFVKKPDYHPALSVGSRNTEILQKEVFLYAKDGKLIKIKNKADVISAAGDRGKEAEKFIKVNQLNVNKPLGLVRAFEFINKK